MSNIFANQPENAQNEYLTKLKKVKYFYHSDRVEIMFAYFRLNQ